MDKKSSGEREFGIKLLSVPRHVVLYGMSYNNTGMSSDPLKRIGISPIAKGMSFGRVLGISDHQLSAAAATATVATQRNIFDNITSLSWRGEELASASAYFI